MSEKITLSGVPETMLQTVYARAKETKTRGAITDNKAVEIIDRLDYDFSMADKDAAMHSGVIARTIVLDKLEDLPCGTWRCGGREHGLRARHALLPHERLFAARWPTASKTDRFRRLQGKCRSTASSNSAARRTTSSTATR